ncbi:uncharacterized protein LOC130641219 [Hydractinia symbiolongicarpus]|uniref:uncharacterized protein LOC130641219 n=1 Tax=Hydractinia symbiolongicarpus TaxID=13093 RepID=UPI00254EB709|nr:uncharacterized protein LOC130641219 [Hydractinia symbiolongicarpus]
MKMQNELSEMAVQFVKKQTSFIHEFIRLCKYWNKTLFFELVSNNVYVYGRSSIIELLAIDAGLKHHGNFSRSFKTFLETVKNIKTCGITFEETYYRANQVPTSIKLRPYLIDPANPYHNYLADVKEIHLELFSDFASVTLQRLLGGEIFLLFEPQPNWLSQSVRPKNWMMGIRDNIALETPSIEFNKELPSHLRNEESIRSLKNYLAVLNKNVEVLTTRNPVDSSYVQKEVENAIDKLFIGRSQCWSSTTELHSSRVITVTIPLRDGSKKAAKISCNWE